MALVPLIDVTSPPCCAAMRSDLAWSALPVYEGRDSPSSKVWSVGRRDTSPEADRIYRESYQRLSGGERVARSMEMAEEVKLVTLAGIQHRNPDFSPAQIHAEWLRILHGPELSQLLV